jgi:hypothetical protein
VTAVCAVFKSLYPVAHALRFHPQWESRVSQNVAEVGRESSFNYKPNTARLARILLPLGRTPEGRSLIVLARQLQNNRE